MMLPMLVGLAAMAPAAAPVAPNPIRIVAGKAVAMRLDRRPARLFIADPAVADLMARDGQIYVIGRAAGETSYAATDSAGRTIAEGNVTVGYDDAAAAAALAKALPAARIEVTTLRDALLLSGEAPSAAEGDDAVRIAQRFVPGGDLRHIINRVAVTSPVQVMFRDNGHVMAVASRIVAAVGRRVDEATPLVDARLADGSRVNIIIPPLALDGPSISIRKFSRRTIDLDSIAKSGGCSPAMATLLKVAARCRLNILVSGGTGSGKTTLLNALSRMEVALPDAVDLLVICAEAGLSLDVALARVGRELAQPSPDLAGEFALTSVELGFLTRRADAFDALARRAPLPMLQALCHLLVQTERYGTPLAQGLRVLAQEFRANRMLRAEEKAARLPAIMTVPMIAFILPPLFVVLIGPAVVQVMGG